MENTAKAIKLALAGVFAGVYAFLGDLAAPVCVLFGVVVLDYVTGLIKAGYNQKHNVPVKHAKDSGIQSRVAFWGVLKKFSYFLVIAAAFAVDWVLVQIGVDIPFLQYPLAMLVTIWFVLTDLISIFENIAQLGVPLPGILLRILTVAQQTMNREINADEQNRGNPF